MYQAAKGRLPGSPTSSTCNWQIPANQYHPIKRAFDIIRKTTLEVRKRTV